MEKYEVEVDEEELNKELGLTNNEIDEALSMIEEDEKEVATKEENLPAQQKEISIDDITRLAIESYKDIQKHSEEVYDALYAPVVTRNDRSDSSKQTLIESQRIKIESINALASLANAKAKLISAQNKANQGNVGVFINSKGGEDVGINLANLGE